MFITYIHVTQKIYIVLVYAYIFSQINILHAKKHTFKTH